MVPSEPSVSDSEPAIPAPRSSILFDDFLRVDVRVGRVVDVQPFPGARKPAYQLRIDFGPEIGERRSSAQLTELYAAEQLRGRLVLAVVNFPPRQIANFFSEVLVLGVPDADGNVVLVQPDRDVPLGGRLF
jgi:tRNA-binding protein